ncbi:uncharacterized protein LOC125499956 isoform X1 [Athalia rosae]|uniref:uncharacterized protein LOC125499956 isoform X1 n=1 Tax=Athalia rosae TaxID=37344 RepID=UPI00203383A1|nr:uncharacterized protein LOC125499956 isoform X1 [Athalia rosae]
MHALFHVFNVCETERKFSKSTPTKCTVRTNAVILSPSFMAPASRSPPSTLRLSPEGDCVPSSTQLRRRRKRKLRQRKREYCWKGELLCISDDNDDIDVDDNLRHPRASSLKNLRKVYR